MKSDVPGLIPRPFSLSRCSGLIVDLDQDRLDISQLASPNTIRRGHVMTDPTFLSSVVRVGARSYYDNGLDSRRAVGLNIWRADGRRLLSLDLN